MNLYSTALGRVNVSDHGALHTLYTVGPGPAVVRSVSLYAAPGASPQVFAFDGVAFLGLAQLDNSMGIATEVGTFLLYQPLEAGWQVVAQNSAGSSGLWTAMAGGYQFTT